MPVRVAPMSTACSRRLAKGLDAPVIDRVGNYDFIFQTADPARTWASAQRGRLREASSSSSTLTSAMRGTCPGTGWSATSTVADFLTNKRDGLDRPIFTYICKSGTSACNVERRHL